MKKILSICALLFAISVAHAQDKHQQEVANTVAEFRQALIDGDSAKLDKLTDNDLTYGHSAGKLENKTEFIHALASGESDFESIDITDQVIVVKNKTAVVRHKLAANIKNNGVFGPVKLGVLMVFVKEHKQWKLLARQAVKI